MKVSSTKTFEGSKPKEFYGEDYFLNAVGSNYGRKDKNGKLLYSQYNESSYLPQRKVLAHLLINLYKPKNVMVLGCARGYTVQAFLEEKVDAYGIDISEWAVTHCAPKVEDRLFQGDICDLSKWQNNFFDLVTGLDVLEHIKVPDLYIALDEVTRITKHTLVIDVPVRDDDLQPDQSNSTDKSHVSVYSPEWWIKQLTERGFILHAKDCYNYPEPNAKGATIIFVKQQKLAKYRTWKNGSWEKPKVDILMLNYNGLDYMPKCIDTLYHNTTIPFNLIVVDNQSTDGSGCDTLPEGYLRFAQKSYMNMIVHCSPQLDSGYAAGINIGLKHCKSPYIILLNNDMLILQKGWLKKLLAHFTRDKTIGIVSPKMVYPNKRVQYAGATFNNKGECYHIGRNKNSNLYTKEREIPMATFACVAIKRDLLKEGLDEEYLVGTWEDVDFCTKTRFNGYKIWFDPSIVLVHYEGATQFTRVIEYFMLQTKINADRFMKKWWFWLRMNMQAHPEVYRE